MRAFLSHKILNSLSGEVWEDAASCRYCECHVSGVALCWRAESCPFQLVISPVSPSENQDQNNDDDLSANDKGDETDPLRDMDEDFPRRRPILSTFRNTVQSAPPEEDLPGSGDDLSGVASRVDRPQYRHSSRSSGTQRASTTVIVRECKPGKSWKEKGCIRCRCNNNWRKECTDRFCLKARVPNPPPPSRSSSDGTNNSGIERFRGRVIQRPPANWSSRRHRPLPPLRPTQSTACGSYQLNEIYFIDECNSCICLPTGPKCTAVSC